MNRVIREDKFRLIIDCCGLGLIGILDFFYSTFYRSFAKIHIKIPFLNFPVFIGEVALFICLLLFFTKRAQINFPKNNKKFSCVFLSALMLFAWKVSYGYLYWGPLALRHAALFYYPIFAILSYYFYNSQILKYPMIKIPLFVILIGIVKLNAVHPNFTICYAILLSIFSVSIFKGLSRLIMLAFIVLIVIPVKYCFVAPRALFLGSIISILFVLGGIFFISKKRKIYTLPIIFFFVSALLIVTVEFAPKYTMHTLFNISETINRYKQINLVIEHEKKSFAPKLINKLRLYNVISPEEEAVSKRLPFTGDSSLINADSLLKVSNIFTQSQDNKIIGSYSKNNSKPVAQKNDSFLSGSPSAAPQAEKDTGNKSVLPGSLSSIQQVKDVNNTAVTKAPYFAQMNKTTIDLDATYHSSIFRIFIFEDLMEELFKAKAIFGFSFGKPFRSNKLEILTWAGGEWGRDGWISTHNSYLEIIYRTGILGLVILFLFFRMVYRMSKIAFVRSSLNGILLLSISIFWIAVAFFMPIFESPYLAIPFWSIFGLTFKYLKGL